VKTVLYVAAGGAIGAVLRLGINLLLKPENESQFPVHTFMINTIGCLFIGVVFAYIVRSTNTQLFQYFIITGILGGFTTFSSYTMETVYLITKAQEARAVFYILLSNVSGIGAAWAGFNLHKLVQ
jgi:fluoride exporter